MSMSRPYASDSRQQRTLIFSFKYFTIIGDDCSPEYWQRSDNWKRNESRKIDTKEHIPLSTCTSVLALSLSGQPIQILRDSRKRRNGAVYSIWSPWQVLNIRCYPDHHSTFEFEPQEFATGPEAFLARLLAEFRDAQRRFDDIHAKIQKLIYPTNVGFSCCSPPVQYFTNFSRIPFYSMQTSEIGCCLKMRTSPILAVTSGHIKRLESYKKIYGL